MNSALPKNLRCAPGERQDAFKNGAGTASSPRFVSRTAFYGDEPPPPLLAHFAWLVHPAGAEPMRLVGTSRRISPEGTSLPAAARNFAAQAGENNPGFETLGYFLSPCRAGPEPNRATEIKHLSMNRPTPDPSQEGSKRSSAPFQFASREGLGVGSWSQCMRKNGKGSERRLPMNRPVKAPRLQDVGRVP